MTTRHPGTKPAAPGKVHLRHAAHPAQPEASEWLNVIAYDGTKSQPSGADRNITPEYAKALVGAAFMWEHANGDIPWLAHYSTLPDLKKKLHHHPSACGTVVDAFCLGGSLYASVRLNPGIKMPRQIANWMETSLTDICLKSKKGHKSAYTPVELSGTSAAWRPGCRVISQVEPADFRRKMAAQTFQDLTPEQQEAWNEFSKAVDGPALQRLRTVIPADRLAAFSGDFLSSMAAGFALHKEMTQNAGSQQPPKAEPAVVASASGSRYKTMAQAMLQQQLKGLGVPDTVVSNFLDGGGLDIWDIAEPVVASASAAAARGERPEPSGPEPPTKLAQPTPPDDAAHKAKINRLFHTHVAAAKMYMPPGY